MEELKGLTHYKNLFEVKGDIISSINEVFLFVHEMKNFLKGMRVQLGLQPATPVQEVINKVVEAL